MLLSYFEAVFKIVELNTTEVELSGVKIICPVNFHPKKLIISKILNLYLQRD